MRLRRRAGHCIRADKFCTEGDPCSLRRKSGRFRGYYILGADLVCSNDPAIQITADNVRFSLNGFALRGSGGTGILVKSATITPISGVLIEGGTVTGFSTGIALNATYSRVTRITITYSRASSSSPRGIAVLEIGDSNMYDWNTFKHNDTGVVSHGVRTLFTQNMVLQNQTGLSLEQSSGNTIVLNTISNNSVRGILLGSSGHNIVQNCAITNNGEGIDITGPFAEFNRIRYNVVSGNKAAGIDLSQRGVSNVISDNTATRNGLPGRHRFQQGRWPGLPKYLVEKQVRNFRLNLYSLIGTEDAWFG